MTNSVDPTPARSDVIAVVGDRIEVIDDEEIRALIWDLTLRVYSMGVESGKSYARQIEAYDAQARESRGRHVAVNVNVDPSVDAEKLASEMSGAIRSRLSRYQETERHARLI